LNTFFEKNASFYRYGFNGKERIDEIDGVEGSVYDYGFRIYNPRLGKFLSMDPLTKSYPWYTPYQFAGNKPICSIDLDGLEEFTVVAQGAPIPDPNNPNQLVQPVVIYWDITARNKPMVDVNGNPIPNTSQAGRIQYVDVQGVNNQIRRMVPNEQAHSYISERLAISEGGMREKILMDNPNATTVTKEGYSQTILNTKGKEFNNVQLTPPPPLNVTPNFQPNTPNMTNPAAVTAQVNGQAPNINRALTANPANMVTVQANGSFGGLPGGTAVPQPGGGILTIDQIMAGRGAAMANALVAAGIPRARINILPPNSNAGTVNVNVNVVRNNIPLILEDGSNYNSNNHGPERTKAEVGTPVPATTTPSLVPVNP
jgi:RHS repeat-associated protein